MQVFEGHTADDVWRKAAEYLHSDPGARVEEGRGGQTREVINGVLVIHDPRQRWVLSRRPAINPAFALAEVVWILRGRNDSMFLDFWNSQYKRYAGDGETYHGAYGHRIKNHFALNQLDRVYEVLLANPDSRQTVLQIWDPAVDLPDSMGRPVAKDIPCNVCAIPKVRNGSLEWLQILRSNDVFLGMPYNIVQWTSLHEVLAGWLGVKVGSYVHVTHSLHAYERDLSALCQTAQETYAPNTDNLAMDKNTSDHWFAFLERRTERLVSSVSEDDVLDLMSANEIPIAIRNMLMVFGAETCRKHGWLESMNRLIDNCTNPAYRMAWSNWLGRFDQ